MPLEEEDFSDIKSIAEIQHGKQMQEALDALQICFNGIEKKHQDYFDELTDRALEKKPVKLSDFYHIEIPREGGLNFFPYDGLRKDIIDECIACIEAQLPK
jgi:tRNA U34 2-thiouridine synthase MnmA/TrmU